VPGRAYDISRVESERVNSAVTRRVVPGERMTLTYYLFEPQGRFPNHKHEQEQISYVVRGSIMFTLEQSAHQLKPGDLVVIPPGTPHEVLAGPSGAEVLSVVSPARSGGPGLHVLDPSV
jgi:quercetin dioxygenase-like cupin family protein